MSKTWHKGPPPSIGWWPASLCRDASSVRWWNGGGWSISQYEGCSASSVAHAATLRVSSYWQPQIEWQDRPASWPARSRT